MPPKPIRPTALGVPLKVPKRRAPWPPKDTYNSVDVSKTGWDWADAAIMHGIFDPLDLIHFNFQTVNPQEVNWYLRHYVGCVDSDDGKHFSFAGADPGVIFIPQYGYTRKTPGTTAVERKALNALRSIVLGHYPAFWHKGAFFSPHGLEILVQKIENNKIDIIWDTGMKDSGGWRFKESAIYLEGVDFDWLFINGYDDLPTLVHEATHALADIINARDYSLRRYLHIDDEITAFFAEAYWFVDYWGDAEVESQIHQSSEIDTWSASLYLAYIARKTKAKYLELESFDIMHANVIEKSSYIYKETKKVPIFGDNFNPYQTLRSAIRNDATYSKFWFQRLRRNGPVGKR